jgi:hypothetical protein
MYSTLHWLIGGARFGSETQKVCGVAAVDKPESDLTYQFDRKPKMA